MLTREFTSEELAKLVEQAFKTEVPNNRSIDTLISALMTNKINVDEIGDLRLKTIHGFVQSIDDNVLQQISKVLKQ
ncbi:MAG TPA: hypothetical protein PK390_02985 [Fervidobacterium nodosum]|nr:hypothetical protein [Fervidobacterium nodosum]